MTQQIDRKMPDPFDVVQKAFSAWPQIGEAARDNLQMFWKNQDKLLDSMQEFSRGWFDRRRQATKTAIEASKCMCDAENPIDAVQHCQTWMMGSGERVAADVTAWQKHVMNIAELLAAPLSAEGEGRKVDITSVSPVRGGKTHAAA